MSALYTAAAARLAAERQHELVAAAALHRLTATPWLLAVIARALVHAGSRLAPEARSRVGSEGAR